MKKFVFYSVMAGLLLAAVSCGRSVDSKEKVPFVKCEVVSVADSGEVLSFPARVKAAEEVNLAFKVSGTLRRVLAEEGAHIRQGALVAQLDERDYALQMQAVEAEYLGIKAEAERAFALYADSVITAADYDKARYGLQQITAKYENAKNQLADTKLYAPFTGVVKRCIYDSPTVVGAGMPVITLLSSQMPEIEIHIPASVYLRQREINSFLVKFDFLEEAAPLRLISVSPNVNADQLYTVRLALPSVIPVKPSVGMSAMVDVEMKKETGAAVQIPASAIFYMDGYCYVWIVANNKVNKRKVDIGALHANGNATVNSGITVGDMIVTAGANSLKEGQMVKQMPQPSETNTGGLL